jgi:hypothetical protein
MYLKQTETTVRVPIHRWRTTRFVVFEWEIRRHRTLAPSLALARRQEGIRRGSFTETHSRAP